jgi:OmpA-OmpF porin, OOP family
MRNHLLKLGTGLFLATSIANAQTDSLIYAEGKIIDASTKELVTARITYQSLPYGNKVGVITNNAYSFPLFDDSKYSITVEAKGFSPIRYIIDPAEANAHRKVIKDIELSNASAAPNHVGDVMRLNNLIFEIGRSRISSESFSELDAIANMMRQNPKMIIQTIWETPNKT